MDSAMGDDQDWSRQSEGLIDSAQDLIHKFPRRPIFWQRGEHSTFGHMGPDQRCALPEILNFVMNRLEVGSDDLFGLLRSS